MYFSYTILFRLESDRTLAIRWLFGCKKSKERLSIALCANADRSHKLHPLVISKYANLQYFKYVNIVNLPITYQSNSKA